MAGVLAIDLSEHKSNMTQVMSVAMTDCKMVCMQLDVVDIWSQHTPWPLNQIPKTYSFLVKNGFLWRFGYYTNQPRFMHRPFLKMTAFMARQHIGAVFGEYNPDLIVSVHPLLQQVPLTILRNRIKYVLKLAVVATAFRCVALCAFTHDAVCT